MKTITEEIINPKMLLDLGFQRSNDELDDIWLHPKLTVMDIRLHDFNGAYHFVVIGSITGIGTMETLDELIDGFEFVTSGQKLIK